MTGERIKILDLSSKEKGGRFRVPLFGLYMATGGATFFALRFAALRTVFLAAFFATGFFLFAGAFLAALAIGLVSL